MSPCNLLLQDGFATLKNVYDPGEVTAALQHLEAVDRSRGTVRQSADLFAIRQVLKELPGLAGILLNENLKRIVHEVLGGSAFVVKSIYFDKPPASNWYVPYHQDLTVSVDRKADVDGFHHWTVKQDQFSVQPPLAFLENIVTVRIHLDATDEANGALRVVPRSHLAGIARREAAPDWPAQEVSCNVPAGGVMLLKPLLLHRSKKTVNNQRRRVLHLEFSNLELPDGLGWAERLPVFQAA